MKQLILIRHAKAEKDADSDRMRMLSTDGVLDAAAQGDVLRQLDLSCDLIVHSPAERARQTAEIIAAKLDMPPGYLLEDSELYGADEYTFIDIMRELPDDIDSVAVVAHNPTLAYVVATLSLEAPEKIRPADAVILKFDTEHWRDINSNFCMSTEYLPRPE